MDIAVTDFPQPLSPIIPIDSPLCIVNDIFFTASIIPFVVLNFIWRSSTFNKRLYDYYAHRFIESYNWPFDLYVYHEGWHPPKEGIFFRDINKYNPDGKGLAINKDQALKVKSFEEWADKNNKRYIQNEAVIDITDFNPDGLQTREKTGNKILPEGVDNDRYIPNFHYLDVTTGILYKVNDSGTELIVVDMEE